MIGTCTVVTHFVLVLHAHSNTAFAASQNWHWECDTPLTAVEAETPSALLAGTLV